MLPSPVGNSPVPKMGILWSFASTEADCTHCLPRLFASATPLQMQLSCTIFFFLKMSPC